jgi:hypothetical protein
MSRLTLSVVPAASGFRRAGRRSVLHVLLAAAAMAAFPRTSSAELPKYLADGCNVVLVINFKEVYDGPHYQKLKTEIATLPSPSAESRRISESSRRIWLR